MADGSDREAIKKIRRGEIDCYRLIVDKYLIKISLYARGKVKDPADADDIVQNTFINFYKSLDKFDISRPVYPYLLTIARNETIHFYRERKQVFPLDENLVGEDDPFMRKILDISAVYRSLPEKSRRVLKLHMDGYTYREIAGILGKPINTIKTLLRRAKFAARKGGAV